MHRTDKGFTLVEVLTVLLVVSILIAVMLPFFGNISDKVRAYKMKIQMEDLKKQVIKYNMKYNEFPDSLSQLQGEFIIKVPLNPSGKLFFIEKDINGDFFIKSESNNPEFTFKLFIASEN
ncbi:MAG: prepilin-type N-terminal cleavage/methylation domain-containing protein [Candidatus Muirbacterium halophilum]|nr:prepilin-type N-terminal cleavage/methylation domain-containing protein [Candidatus Muirbacterium halophilum]